MNPSDNDAILFANDNPSFLMYVSILVKHLGYKVFLALDSQETIRIAREKRPAVIVLDHALPKMDGVSCLHMIRSDALLKETPVLMLGAEDNGLTRETAGAMDVQGYLIMPLNVTEFYVALQQCLRHSIKRRHVRTPLSLRVTVNHSGGQTDFFASNLSVEGIFLRTTKPYAVGTEINLILDIDDEDPIELKGLTVSVHQFSASAASEPGMGVKFLDIPEDIRYRLYYHVMKEITQDIITETAGEAWFDDTYTSD